jgi:hypothetical protein
MRPAKRTALPKGLKTSRVSGVAELAIEVIAIFSGFVSQQKRILPSSEFPVAMFSGCERQSEVK